MWLNAMKRLEYVFECFKDFGHVLLNGSDTARQRVDLAGGLYSGYASAQPGVRVFNAEFHSDVLHNAGD